MGKQLCFYMSEKDKREFNKFIASSSFVLLNRKGESIKEINENVILYLYKKECGKLVYNNESIDILSSPVIEYWQTTIKENTIKRGRIWLSDSYPKEYYSEYQQLTKWIKKNITYTEIPKGTHSVKEYVSEELLELNKQTTVSFV